MNMKKAYVKGFKFTLFTFIVCLIFFNSSCGLDTYFVMEDPVIGTPITPSPENTQFEANYFEFTTNENGEYPNNYQFLGTEIYYKIYSSLSTLKSETGVLDNYASDKEKSAKAPDKLMFTTSQGGYEYKRLKASNYQDSPLIKPGKSYQKVYIRLTDFQSDPLFESKITVDGKSLNGDDEISKPIRCEDKLTFNFGRRGEKDKVPTSDDEDVNYSSTPTDNIWYVCLYAVAVARDVTYQNYYSNICYLGAVQINDSVYDN